MLTKARSIQIAGQSVCQTPLLVPSLSSKAIPHATTTDLFDFADTLIADEILLSAYDVHYHGITANVRFPSLLIFDSGGYEASSNPDLCEITPAKAAPLSWDSARHSAVVAQLTFEVPTLLVSYDHPDRVISLEQQVAEAVDLFARFPKAGGTLLLKPSAEDGGLLGVDRIVECVGLLAPFAVIGVTEKELGTSLLQRMLNVARLRRALTTAGLETPLHVFGSLDTVLPPLYFLAGADIFDGLAWLRYAFCEGQTVYTMSHAAQCFAAATPDSDALLQIWSANYFELIRLQESMREFAQSGRYSSFRYHREFYQKMIHTLTNVLEGN